MLSLPIFLFFLVAAYGTSLLKAHSGLSSLRDRTLTWDAIDDGPLMQSTKIRSCIPSRNMKKLETSYLKLERRCVRDMSEENLKRKTQGVLGPTLGMDLSKMREIGVAGFTSINKQITNHKYIYD